MAIGARVWKQVLVRIFPHTSVSGKNWQRITYGTTSGAGAAGGTTVVATSVISGAGDTYNGRYWIQILSGTCKGQWKRIVDDDGSGAYTVENNGYSAQIAGSVRFAIWKSPEPVIVVDSSGAATDVVDAIREEADDYWNSYYVMPITGNRRGEIKQVSDFVSATGTYTVGAFSGVLAAGDVCLLGKFIEVEVSALPGEHAYIPRPMSRVNNSEADGTVGARGGSFAFTSRVYGSGTLTAADAEANPSVLSPLFPGVGLEEMIGSSATIDAGSSTTAVKIATGKWENFQIGQCVEWMGNVRRITGLTDGGGAVDTVTVSPAFPTAPVSADVLHGMRNYYKSTDASGLYGCGIEVEIDGIRTVMTGLKGTMTVNPPEQGPVELGFEFSVDHWIAEKEAAPYNPGDAYTTQPDILGKDKQAWLDTDDVDIKGFTAAVGQSVTAMNQGGSYGVNGRTGYHHTGYACGATFREIMDDADELEAFNRFEARTEKSVFVVYGSHGNACAIALPKANLIESPISESGDGLVEAPNVLAAHDAGTWTDPDDTIGKVPDWMFSHT